MAQTFAAVAFVYQLVEQLQTKCFEALVANRDSVRSE